MPTPTKSYIDDGNGGTFPFISISGEFKRSGQTLEDITRKGTDGQAFRLTGQRGEMFDVEATVDLTDYPTAQSLWDSLIALRGSIVTIVDDFGQSFDQIIVHNVGRPKQRPGLSAVGGVNSNSPVGQARSISTFRLTLQDTTITAES
jgi:hypothetical protein